MMACGFIMAECFIWQAQRVPLNGCRLDIYWYNKDIRVIVLVQQCYNVNVLQLGVNMFYHVAVLNDSHILYLFPHNKIVKSYNKIKITVKYS